MKISCLRVKTHLVFHWCLYNKRFSYHFIKMWNSDQLPEQVYQPLGTQNDCATVLDNYPHVMIHNEPHRLSNQKNFVYLAEIGD